MGEGDLRGIPLAAEHRFAEKHLTQADTVESPSQFSGAPSLDAVSLAEPVQALIAQPLMMALIAETYANTGLVAQAAVEIPRELDYFTLFRKLTDRKLAGCGLKGSFAITST